MVKNIKDFCFYSKWFKVQLSVVLAKASKTKAILLYIMRTRNNRKYSVQLLQHRSS